MREMRTQTPSEATRRSTSPPRWHKGDYPCPLCPKVLHNSVAILKHLETKAHRVKVNFTRSDFSCPHCPKKLKSKTGYMKHLRSSHEIPIDAAFMELLGRKLEGRNGSAAPASQANNLQCPECDYVAESPRSLGVHRRFRHGVLGQNRNQAAKKKPLALVPSNAIFGRTVPLVPRQTQFCPRCGVRAGLFCSECGANMALIDIALNHKG